MGCNTSKAFQEESASDSSVTGLSSAQDGGSADDLLGLISMHEQFVKRGDMNGSIVRMEAAFGTSIDDVYVGAKDGTTLGFGAFGVVRRATHKSSGVDYAVKNIQLNRLPSKEAINQLRDEISLMCELDHPSIVRIIEVFESRDEIFIVQELCAGGDLFDRMEARFAEAQERGDTDLTFSEAQCSHYVKQMLCAAQYLHSKGIVHRDLKIEHFMFQSVDSEELSLIDFGFASRLDATGHMSGMAGTLYAAAPEVLRGENYNEKFDIWSIGVLAYLLVAGDTPFGSLDEASDTRAFTCAHAINHSRLVFEPEETWDQVSEEGKRFIQRMLCRDPLNRPSATEALQDPWIAKWTQNNLPVPEKLNSDTLNSLIDFKKSSGIRKMLSEVLSYTLLPEQMSGLRREFKKIDTGCSGVITSESLRRVLLRSANEFPCICTEVDKVFECMKVSKTARTISWHEFLAATMSMAKYDDRNIRLAFDLLDTKHHGFLTIEDFIHLLGCGNERGILKECWRSIVDEVSMYANKISYETFVALIKGPVLIPLRGARKGKGEPTSMKNSSTPKSTRGQSRKRQFKGSVPFQFVSAPKLLHSQKIPILFARYLENHDTLDRKERKLVARSMRLRRKD